MTTCYQRTWWNWFQFGAFCQYREVAHDPINYSFMHSVSWSIRPCGLLWYDEIRILSVLEHRRIAFWLVTFSDGTFLGIRSRDVIVGITSSCGQTVRGSNPCRSKLFFSSPKSSRLTLGPNLSPVYWVLGFFTDGKVAGAWSWLLISIQCQGEECVDLNLCSPYLLSWRGQGQLDLLSSLLLPMH